jgi:GPN-loop GTPase
MQVSRAIFRVIYKNSKLICPASILYKTKLPFILVFNKTDVQPHDFALEWMQDFEAFQAALASHGGTRDSEGEPTYMNSLMNSMSLVLDEFYKHLKVRGKVIHGAIAS